MPPYLNAWYKVPRFIEGLETFLANAQVILLVRWIFRKGATHIVAYRKKGVEKLQTLNYIYSIGKALFKKSSTTGPPPLVRPTGDKKVAMAGENNCIP